MTTLVCRVRTQHRLLIETRTDLGWRPLYAGTLVDDAGRPAHRNAGGKPVRGQVDRISFRTAPIRLAPCTPIGLCELMLALDGDAELFE